MIQIAKYNCKDKTEARIKEQEHYSELNSSLNSCPPYVDKTKYFCSTCNINCNTKNVYETHINCNLHKKNIQLNNKLITQTNIQNIPHKFYCDKCYYGCSKFSVYNQHLSTSKHQNATNIFQKNLCDCGKQFQHHSSYYRHKKKCSQIMKKEENKEKEKEKEKNETIEIENNISSELIIEIIKQNQEFKDLLLEQNKTIIELSKKWHNKY